MEAPFFNKLHVMPFECSYCYFLAPGYQVAQLCCRCHTRQAWQSVARLQRLLLLMWFAQPCGCEQCDGTGLP